MNPNIIPNSETLFLSQKHLTKFFANSYSVNRFLVDACEGKKNPAAILSILVYWSSTSKNGQSRLRIIKKGEYWIAKTDEDWWKECRLTVSEARKAVKYLEDNGWIEKRKFKFKGAPVCHYRIRQEEFAKRLDSLMSRDALDFSEKGKTNNSKELKPIKGDPQIHLGNSDKTITDSTSSSTSFSTFTQSAASGETLNKSLSLEHQEPDKGQAFQEYLQLFHREYGCPIANLEKAIGTCSLDEAIKIVHDAHKSIQAYPREKIRSLSAFAVAAVQNRRSINVDFEKQSASPDDMNKKIAKKLNELNWPTNQRIAFLKEHYGTFEVKLLSH